MPYDYKVTDTSFAGPTCFQRGDTLYINQKGERVALQRSTAIRYQVREAKEKKLFSEPQGAGVDRRAAGRARGAEARRSSTRSRRSATTSGSSTRVKVGDQLAEQRARPAQPRQLHHRVAGLPDDHVGRHGQGPHHGAGRGARLHEGDGRLRGRPPHGAGQPRAHRRRLLRPVARPPPAAVGRSTSACRAATATARRWARGSSTTSPRGPASGASSRTPPRSTATPPSPATPPSSPARSSTSGSSASASTVVTVKVELRNQDDAVMAKAEVDVELPVE